MSVVSALASPSHEYHASGLRTEIDALGGRECDHVGHTAAGKRGQVNPHQWPVRHAGFFARQRQQLLRQPRGALQAASEFGKRRLALGVAGSAFGELRLQMHRRERRAQLVRRIGDERALRGQRLPKAFEQSVEGVDQRLHFTRHRRIRPAARALWKSVAPGRPPRARAETGRVRS